MERLERLSQKERDVLFSNLDEEQKKFINDYLKRGRRTIFANVLAKEKASAVTGGEIEDVAEKWMLMDYIDAGPEWRANPQLFCECGRPLRYQYVLQNLETGEVKKFGITHFEEHTSISPQLVRDIVKGIEQIDYEMDEVLMKAANGWTLAQEGIFGIPESVEIPEDIKQQLAYDVPLLSRQVQLLKKILAKYLHEQRTKQMEIIRQEQEMKAQKRREEMKQKRKMLTEVKQDKQSAYTLNIPLEQELQLGVFVYLDNLTSPIFKASDLCEDLIKYHGATKERYSSGTPVIYANVCIFLKHLEAQGLVELVEKQGVKDLVYRYVER
ncbi:DUF3895 domain-containing protein [Aquibacillus salsiterrae]|uniref:DUF3895 domain-containing protein n=1 Tax=Aquibacillus salsiterrae TaxID=2950439 RepID=A0A9X4AFF1_9BACI|nr:DUF3895 domain-containing protein [Aquibacillus salsiterrae]MDC3417594.1 DUF3895 domain-containing protein [Aquibacillus salsiterrae]